ncbi:MAG: HAMP domain-containing protein [Desulfobulbaceae bacterium]|nr:HAMP domain-containing protein [Desulfobulbaceae bacterium]
MRLKSIRGKLLLGGFLIVLIPMATIMFISNKKSSAVMGDMAKEYAQSMAVKLSEEVTLALEGAKNSVVVLINDAQLIEIAEDINAQGTVQNAEKIAIIQKKVEKVSSAFKNTYPDLFVATAKGELYAAMFGHKTDFGSINIFDRAYFQQVKKEKKVVLSDPIRSKGDGTLVMVACGPILSDAGEFLGVLGVTIKAEAITSIVTREKSGKTGYAFMANSKGIIIAHPKKELELTLDLNTLDGMAEITQSMRAGKTGVVDYYFKGSDKIAGFAPVPMNSWSVAYTKESREFLQAAVDVRNLSILLLIASLAVVACVILIASRSIVIPINKAVEGLKDIAEGEGDLTRRLDVNSGDEIEVLAEWFNTFIVKLHKVVGDINSNLTALRTSADHFSSVSESMLKGSDDASNMSNTVAVAAEEMSANMNAVAAASEQAATNVNMVAIATDEMNATVSEIAGNTSKARDVTEKAVAKTKSTSMRMDELGGAAQDISKVTETITEISDQTNLLALNATIEAARAGEAGKGFAVVANEIKELAKQTADATLEIRQKIHAIQTSTNTSVSEMGDINLINSEINEIVTTIAMAVDDQSESTENTATNVGQAALGIAEVNENVVQSSAVSGEISQEINGVSKIANKLRDDSNIVNTQSNELLSLIEKLQTVVNQFKL